MNMILIPQNILNQFAFQFLDSIPIIKNEKQTFSYKLWYLDYKCTNQL